MFYCSKKPCSYEVFSADQVPLRKPLHAVHTHEYCKCLEYFGEITKENLSYTLFLQLLRSISRSHRAVKQFDLGAGAVPLWLCLLQSPCAANEPSHEQQELGLVWVGNELRFGSLLLSKQSFEVGGRLWGWCGNGNTGCCCSTGNLTQLWYKWCCQKPKK